MNNTKQVSMNFIISIFTGLLLAACTQENIPDHSDVPSELNISVIVSEINPAKV